MYMFYFHVLILVFVLFLFMVLLVYSFYSVETFIQSNATAMIELNKNLPISSIVIRPARDIYNDAWINLADITILDEKENKVEYWRSPNSVNFQNGNRGWENYWGPIHELYDNNINTAGHSSTAPDTLFIILNPALMLGSIQITNRNDCCAERIQKYDLEIYNANERLAVKPLTNLGEKVNRSRICS